jgi:hypothetical protein
MKLMKALVVHVMSVILDTGFIVPGGENVFITFTVSFLNYDQQQKCSPNMNSQIGRVNGT